MDTLEVPGAHLSYRMTGSGPVLLLIPGGPADAGGFDRLARLLDGDHTVVTYDPRGISRSSRADSDDDVRVATQADDAHRLLAAVGAGPADVLGNSGGAITALELVAMHPTQVRTLVAHEPPVSELLPDGAEHRAKMDEVHQTYLDAGAGAAMAKFMSMAGLEGGPAPDTGPPNPEMLAAMARMKANMELFFAHMLRPIVAYRPDATALRAATTRIVPGVGTTTTGQIAHRSTLALAELLGAPVADFPGGHGGFAEQPEEFAAKLRTVLAESSV
ncbi:MAG TPA: alpha/beta hydrolase [Pseudonocardiaceae bacterium]|nr:alpha/beta hydrolase [Pseudonocardiaceae bacterium]